MESLKIALVAYGFTIVFALLIACAIPGLGWMIKKLRLDDSEALDLSVPTSNSLKEEEAIAVAIAVARARRK
jgi:Na+-transporting methylmalonyl-CoA/oxaloacetate decarboxylase gamma subunit